MAFSSEAVKAGLAAPEKPVTEMTEEERKAFRALFDPDQMGFDGVEGTEEDKEGDNDGSKAKNA